MAAKRPDLLPLLRVNVTTEHHQGLDCFGHERGCLVDIGEGIRAWPGRLGALPTGGVDLRFDDAGVAVVDRSQDCDRPSVATCVPDEELFRRARRGCFGHVPRAAFWAACATVCLSAKPLSLATSVPGLA